MENTENENIIKSAKIIINNSLNYKEWLQFKTQTNRTISDAEGSTKDPFKRLS